MAFSGVSGIWPLTKQRLVHQQFIEEVSSGVTLSTRVSLVLAMSRYLTTGHTILERSVILLPQERSPLVPLVARARTFLCSHTSEFASSDAYHCKAHTRRFLHHLPSRTISGGITRCWLQAIFGGSSTVLTEVVHTSPPRSGRAVLSPIAYCIL